MKKFFESLNVVGALLLSLPVLAGAAGVARAEGTRIGMDLSTPMGVASFTQQVNQQANRLCRDETRLQAGATGLNACRGDVWDEVMDQLTPAQKAALSAGRGAKATVAVATTTPFRR